MPARRNGPVSSNVSRQPIKWVDPSSQLKCRLSETSARGGCRAANTVPARCRQQRRTLALQLTPVCGWHFAPACCAAQSVRRARRCSAVLRLAPAGHSQRIRRSPKHVGPCAPGGAAGSLQHGSLDPCLVIQLASSAILGFWAVTATSPPRKSVAQFQLGRSNGFKTQAPAKLRQCWLTLRSTRHFAAVQFWFPFHSNPKSARRKVQVSLYVRPLPHHRCYSTAER